jgi:hypothetical protein
MGCGPLSGSRHANEENAVEGALGNLHECVDVLRRPPDRLLADLELAFALSKSNLMVNAENVTILWGETSARRVGDWLGRTCWRMQRRGRTAKVPQTPKGVQHMLQIFFKISQRHS